VRGQPIDARPPERARRLRQKAVGDFEWAAARVVARLTGAPVTLQDDGSHNGMPDIRIDYKDRPPAFMEVWTDIDSNYAAMYATLRQPKDELPNIAAAPRLRRDWQVTLGRTAHVRKVQAEMNQLLGALEDGGETFEVVATRRVLQSKSHPSVRRLVELGVDMLSSSPSEQGTVRLYPAGISGPAVRRWEPVLKWIAETLASERLADVRAKLDATHAGERHVFVGPTYTSPGDVFFALTIDERTLPLERPQLPPEITHLWLMNTTVDRCIVWFPDRGWFEPMWHWATE